MNSRTNGKYCMLCVVEASEYDYSYLSRAVSEQASNGGVVLSTASASSQTRDQNYKKGKFHLNVQNLTNILHIDSVKKIATVQTKCTFSQLAKITLQQGLIPKVVPEFTSITVGGAFVGGGLESTSHRHGQVSDIVQRATVLLGNGTLVNATGSTNKDLFYALCGSYGTLGVVLELDIELMDAEPYVELTTQVYSSIRQGVEALIATAQDSHAAPVFHEALQFPCGSFVIVSGNWKHSLEDSDIVAHPATGRGLWFYEQIYDVVTAQGQHESEECKAPQRLVVPTYDYLFRYERGAFWMARPMEFDWSYCRQNIFTCGLFVASSRQARFFFSDMFSATRLYKMLHLAHPAVAAQRMVVMDADVPADKAIDLVEYVRAHVPITTPIWLLPVRAPDVPQAASNTGHANPGELIINVGIYGRVPDDEGISYSRQLTEQVMNLGGRNMLYSQLDMTEEEFCQHQVDQVAFEAVRTAYGAGDVFPQLHEKVLRISEQEIGGLRYRLTQLLL